MKTTIHTSQASQKNGIPFVMLVMFGLVSQMLFVVLSLLATALIAFPVNATGKDKEEKEKKKK